jgi:DNA (cytosine-5)-methyltransferase 1
MSEQQLAPGEYQTPAQYGLIRSSPTCGLYDHNLTSPRLLALCSGYGGLEIAAENLLGTEVVAHAENNPHAAQVFEAHHPGVPNLGDITKADWRKVRDHFEPEILTAGFPCTDISNAGLRIGIHGKRSGIWKNVAEAICFTRPRLVLLENVAAIRSRGLDVVAADLAEIGYDARWTCVRAGDPEVGAPHKRDRWLCVAHPAPTDPDDRGGYGWARDLAEACRGNEPAHAGDAPTDAQGVELLPTPVVADARGTRNFTSNRREGAEFNSGKTLTDVAWLLSTPKASDVPHGGPNQRDANGNYYLPGQAVRLDQDWVATDGADYGPAIRRWEAVTGRAAPLPTEAGTRGNRRVAPAFAEWMMGLPSGHVTGRGIERRFELQMIGNGVVPQQAEYAYRVLLNPEPPDPDRED